jgi:hypothetical protein
MTAAGGGQCCGCLLLLGDSPREILVSGMVKDLVAGSGIEFDDRGEHDLKGVPGSGKLFAAQF